MADQAYKDWYVQGLRALMSAIAQDQGDPGDAATSIQSQDLKELMTGSSKVMAEHSRSLSHLLQKAGGTTDGMHNVIMEGIRAGAGQMIQSAKDTAVRDASVIAASQIAVHYYIAAYGTLASTASHLGLEEDAKTLKQMCDQMKVGDEHLVRVAKGAVNDQAAAR